MELERLKPAYRTGFMSWLKPRPTKILGVRRRSIVRCTVQRIINLRGGRAARQIVVESAGMRASFAVAGGNVTIPTLQTRDEVRWKRKISCSYH